MSDLLLSVLFENIRESIELIEKRFEAIATPDDFIYLDDGIDRLDAIAMRLQVIGEELKKVDKVDSRFLSNYPAIEWRKIKGLRDVIAHQYVDINVELIYDICTMHLPSLKKEVQHIIKDLEK